MTARGGEAASARGHAGALRVLAELRLRLLWRRLRGRGGIPELVARLVMIVVAIPAGLVFAGFAGVGAWHAARAGTGLRATVPTVALFFGVWQTWTAVALSLAEREAIDLRRFLAYPLPPSRVYAYGVVASVVGDPFSVFWCLLLLGAFVGAAAARPGAWVLLLAAVYALFVAATAATVALLQELLARLLRGRRARELGIATVYVGTAFLVAWGGSGGARGALRAFHAVREARWILFPPALASEATRELYAGRLVVGAAWALALAAATAVAGWAAYRLALSDALSGAEGAHVRGASAGQGWRLPGRLGPLLEKEGKYLLRHPLASILALVVPALAGFVGWKLAPLIPAEAGDVVRALPLLAFALYSHLTTQVFWLNAFGWDRGGARLYFLAPVDLPDVILAKNLACYGLSAALYAACAAALVAFAGAPPAWAALGAMALHVGIAPWLLGAGNLVSLLNPRAATHTIQRGGRLAPTSGLAGLAIVSGFAGLFGAPVLLAIRLEEPWLLPGAWLALGLAGLALYRRFLPATARLLASRREPLLDKVAGDEE